MRDSKEIAREIVASWQNGGNEQRLGMLYSDLESLIAAAIDKDRKERTPAPPATVSEEELSRLAEEFGRYGPPPGYHESPREACFKAGFNAGYYRAKRSGASDGAMMELAAKRSALASQAARVEELERRLIELELENDNLRRAIKNIAENCEAYRKMFTKPWAMGGRNELHSL